MTTKQQRERDVRKQLKGIIPEQKPYTHKYAIACFVADGTMANYIAEGYTLTPNEYERLKKGLRDLFNQEVVILNILPLETRTPTLVELPRIVRQTLEQILMRDAENNEMFQEEYETLYRWLQSVRGEE